MATKLTAAQHADLTAALAAGDLSLTPRPIIVALLKMLNPVLDSAFPAEAALIDAAFAYLEGQLSGTP